MSIAGTIALRGSRISVRRATETEAADASTRLAWASIGSNVRMAIETMSAGLMQRVWGEERQAALHGRVPAGTDIAERDGIIVNSGDYAGQKFRVVGVQAFSMGSASGHIEVALQSTTEAFA